MLLSAFNSKRFLRNAGAIQLAIVFCCTVQPASAQSTTNAVAKTSTILIDTDDACRLSVDGSDEGVVTPDEVTKIKIHPGGHILKCSIEKAPDLVWRTVIETKSGEQTAALISVKALHDATQSSNSRRPRHRQSHRPRFTGNPTAHGTGDPRATVPAARRRKTTQYTASEERSRRNVEEQDPQRLFAVLQGHPLGTRRCQISSICWRPITPTS